MNEQTAVAIVMTLCEFAWERGVCYSGRADISSESRKAKLAPFTSRRIR